MLWTKAIGINATSLAGSHLLCHGATYFYISYLLTASLPSSWPVINCSFYCICFVLMSFLVSRLCLCFFPPPPSSSATLRLCDIVLTWTCVFVCVCILFVFVYVCVFIPPSPPSSATFRPLWRQLLSKLERSKNAQPVPSSHHMVDVIIITIINILIIFTIIRSHGGCHHHQNYHGLQNHHIIYWM